ncbi:ABC transporter permease [Segetibacter koreensis]|uniref:ABC transporter permease n=1 Tax=Segetibacter koreensis TaxID=398037 RepID=UPI000477423F|nr:FtsX-like permease family protein [Segetibacter koreensis]
MNVPVFIATRIAFNSQQSFSRFIIRLAITATAVSVAAMILTLAFVNGFQETVSQKVFSFWGHLRLQQYEPSKALVAEESPLTKNDSIINGLKKLRDIETIQPFATKSAVLQQQTNIEGILFKGVEKTYNFANLKNFLRQGRWPSFSDTLYSHDIAVSAAIADQLQIKLNDSIKIHFIDAAGGKSSFRRLKVSGIFKTGIEEYDNLFAIGDLRLIQRLNNWQPEEIGGYEVFLHNYKMMDSVNGTILNSDLIPPNWTSKTVREVYPNIFDWLGIQDVNRNVIFIVMAVVAIINLVTCLLILVLERTRMVGILKAIGSSDAIIQKIFLFNATYITLIGAGAGFIFGVGLCLLQQKTGFITLNESAYYVSVAPVKLIWWQVAAVCGGTVVVCFLSLILPTLIVKSVQPVKAIQFR